MWHSADNSDPAPDRTPRRTAHVRMHAAHVTGHHAATNTANTQRRARGAAAPPPAPLAHPREGTRGVDLRMGACRAFRSAGRAPAPEAPGPGPACMQRGAARAPGRSYSGRPRTDFHYKPPARLWQTRPHDASLHAQPPCTQTSRQLRRILMPRSTMRPL